MTLKPANYNYRRTTGTSLTGGRGMGYVYADIELINEDHLVLHRHGMLPEEEIKRITCRVLVDTGAWDLVINEDIQKRLNLQVVERGPVKLADETLIDVDIVGPIVVRFENKRTIVNEAVVLPGTSEVLLGAYPLQGLDAFIDSKRERLLVHPDLDNPKSYIRPVRQVSLSI